MAVTPSSMSPGDTWPDQIVSTTPKSSAGAAVLAALGSRARLGNTAGLYPAEMVAAALMLAGATHATAWAGALTGA